MDSSSTSLTLLAGLLDPKDQAAWEQFDASYRPMLVRFGLRLGLAREDAGEAAQRTAVAVCRAFRQGQYDRKKGRLRSWLLGIARHEIADLCKERDRQPTPVSERSSIADAVALLSDPETLSALWEREWQEHALGLCLQRAKQQFSSRDMRIFEMLAFKRMSADQVSREMDVSRAAVYLVKHRVLKFIVEVKGDLGDVE